MLPGGTRYDLPAELDRALDKVRREMLIVACQCLLRQDWVGAEVPLCQAYNADPQDPAAELLLASLYRAQQRSGEWDAARKHLQARHSDSEIRGRLAGYDDIHTFLPGLLEDALDDIRMDAKTPGRPNRDALWSGPPLYSGSPHHAQRR